MKIRWIKLVAGPIAAEVTAILILICLVAIFGPNDAVRAQAYAEKLGAWVGPLAGVVLSFVGALWVSRGLTSGHLLHGFLFGCLYALLDAALIVAAQAPFAWLFVASDAGKLLAGIAGGLVAARSARRKRGQMVRRFHRLTQIPGTINLRKSALICGLILPR